LKVAVGLVLRRFTTNRVHIWIIWILCAATILVCTVYFFIALFQCSPISYWWDLDPTSKGSCISPYPLMITSYAASALNSLADWCFGILPIFIVRRLHVRRHTKYVVGGILSFAAVGCIATLIRMPYVKQFKTNKNEWLYDTVELAIWSTVEVGMGIIAASLPTLRPLLQPLLTRLGIDLSTDYREPTFDWVKSSPKEVASPVQGFQRPMSLDEVRRFTGNDDVVITTITSNKDHGRGEEAAAERSDQFLPDKGLSYGSNITRVVEVSSVDESTGHPRDSGHGEVHFVQTLEREPSSLSLGYQHSAHNMV